LHTHDDSGVIHIEAPKRYVPVLGEFFDIWGEPLSPSRAAAARAAATHLVRTYVDGKVYHGNPRSIPLHDHTDITIEVGPPFKAPTRYDFSGNGY
jgi:hypothetical protein